MKERVYIFDNLKFVLIWLVVLGHSMEPFVDRAPLLKSAFIFIYTFHMPAFIFITGLFAVKTVKNTEKCRSKIYYFLILYIILKCLWSLVNYIRDDVFALHLFWEKGLPWFLFTLAVYYAMTSFLKNIPVKSLFVISIILACVFGYDRYVNDYLCLSRVIVYYPFFLAGYGIGHKKMITYCRNLYMKIFGILTMLILLFFCFFKCNLVYQFRPLVTGRNPFQTLADSMVNGSSLYMYGGMYRLIYYLIVFMILFALVAISINQKIIFTKIGERTLSIYFFHMFFLTFVRNTSFYTRIDAYFHGLMLLVVHLCFSLFIVLLFSLRIWQYPFLYLEKLSGKRWKAI